jgi:glycosyltransferase involved in cell wall biosynthesis
VEVHVHGVLTWFPDYVERLRQSAQGLPAHFHGGFDPRDVDRVYASIDVLCAPSLWYENHPLTIQDAFRHGVPVIATDLGGMSEVVVHGVSGLCFPRGDASALAAAIERILVEPELYGRLARSRPKVASIADIAERIEAVYLAGTGVDAR